MDQLRRPEDGSIDGPAGGTSSVGRRATTQTRHQAMRLAVRSLRTRIGWTQDELAASLDKSLGKKRVTRQSTISKWELGIDAPSPTHRMVLAKIAAKYEHEDLAATFRNVTAPPAKDDPRTGPAA